MQFYYAEEPASPLDFDNDDGDDDRHQRDAFCAGESAARAKSMAPAISRAGAFREPSHSLALSLSRSLSLLRGSIISEYRPSRMSIRRCTFAVHGG